MMEPAGIVAAQPRDREMERLNAIARLLDDCFRVPGTKMRFGFDGIVGLFPGIGDAFTALIGVYLIAVAAKLDIPRSALFRMAANTGLDLAVGAVPFLGDLIDFFFKSNRRNVELVRKHLALPAPAVPRPE